MTAKDRAYFPELDGLRAIAVITVIAGHFLPPSISEFVGMGDSGVVTFFVLSGFLITRILLGLREARPANPLLGFYARRSLRIFPIYYLTLAIALAVGYHPVTDNILRLATYTANFVPGLPPLSLGAASHLWSLSVEEQFYLIWPLLILSVPKRFLAVTLVTIFCCSVAARYAMVIAGAPYLYLFRAVFSSMDALSAGALISLYASRISTRTATMVAIVGVCALAATTAIRVSVTIDPWYRGSELFGVLYFHAVILATAATIYFSTRSVPWLGTKFLNWGPLRFVGRISYGIYVYHFFMPAIIPRLFPMVTGNWLLGSIVAGTFFCAISSWFLIEEPISKLKRRVTWAPNETIHIAVTDRA